MIKIITNNNSYSDEQALAIITEIAEHFALRKGVWSFDLQFRGVRCCQWPEAYLGGVTVIIE